MWLKEREDENLEVRAKALVSFNGRLLRMLIDPDVGLT